MGRVIDTEGQKVTSGNAKYAPLPATEHAFAIYDVTEGNYKPDSAGKGRANYRVQLKVLEGQKGANRRLFETIPLFLEWGSTSKNPEGSRAFTFYQFFAAFYGIKEQEFVAAVKAMTADPKDKETIEAELAKIKNEAVRAQFAEKAGKGLSIPDPSEMLGKKINGVLRIVPDKYAYDEAVKNDDLADGETQNDYLKNEVNSWKPYAEPEPEVVKAEDEGFVL